MLAPVNVIGPNVAPAHGVSAFVRGIVSACGRALTRTPDAERTQALEQLRIAESLIDAPDSTLTRNAQRYALDRVRAYMTHGSINCPHLVAGPDGCCKACSEPVTPRAFRALS